MTSIDADINLARLIAKVLGESSAAARALSDYDQRLASGDKPVFFRNGNCWVVGGAGRLYPAGRSDA